MKLFEYVRMGHLRQQFKTEGLSLRRRFAFYIISVISLFFAVIIILLNLFGILNPTEHQIMDDLSVRLDAYSDSIEKNCDELAACAISFSEQLNEQIQDYLTKNNLSFEDLLHNSDAITELEDTLYDTVYLNMQVAPASGAFYILKPTVFGDSEESLSNGIYLKYVNLYSEHTVNNDFTLYRGAFSTGKNHDIPFHSGWQNAFRIGSFADIESVFSGDAHYMLSPVVEIPETWERARYVYVPIRNFRNEIIGICGFEISDLLLQLSHKTESGKWGTVICGLLDAKTSASTGQFNTSRYNNAKNSLFIKDEPNVSLFEFRDEKCVGKTTELSLGNSTFYVAVMIAETQYESFLQEGRQSLALLFLIVALLALICCVFMSKKYVSPILKKFEQVKSQEEYGDRLRIREIDDLFAYLAERDNHYERQLNALEAARQSAEAEARNTKAAYEKAVEKYELARREVEQLAEMRQTELVPEDYQFFLRNLSTLTPAEYRIYDLYLSGKNAKQIAETLNITENTLKYHNKNIYSKLGISSRKQLLRYATLKQHQDKKKETSHR